MIERTHSATKDAISFVSAHMEKYRESNREKLIRDAIASGFQHKTAALFTAINHLILKGEIVKTSRGHYALPTQAIERPIEEASAANAFIETNKLLAQLRIEIDAANRRLASIEARTASTHQMVSKLHQQAEAKAVRCAIEETKCAEAIGGTD